jgi:hypothetical protein
MMKAMRLNAMRLFTTSLLATCLLALGAGCHSEDGPPPTLSISLDPTTITEGGTTTLTVSVTNFELVDPGAGHAHDGDDHHDEGGVAQQGHYHVYLDTTDENPLIMASTPSLVLAIDAAPGDHSIIVRLNDNEHKIIQPEVRASAELVVEAGGMGGGGGAGGSTAGAGGGG